ncbi:acetyltransferase (GNAT) domain-containing protein [Purpureocillium lavendulum]|uniref:Acetyltransferase (GNAT) domain-containing protein n=1 Tax=Purpureocillium lavendulum TaxID=1247861 RepID=A0AB34G1Z6_9HYPO|nr:acetyltransferase (GNAT) domain-containing protein [Purpureocillium lavendulum]
MDSVISTARDIWRSERLVYRPFDPQDEELQAWMHENVSNDPVVEALSTGDLLRPQTRKQSAAYTEVIAGCLIAVTVCLPEASSAGANDDDDNSNNNNNSSSSNSSNQGETSRDEPRSKPRIIGFAALHATAPSAAHHRSANVALCLADGAQGRGLGGEALGWLVDWGFRHGGLHRVGLQAAAYNERALGLYRRAGFVEEGRLRGRVRFDRRWWDLVEMGMLEEEWEAIRAKGEDGGKGGDGAGDGAA